MTRPRHNTTHPTPAPTVQSTAATVSAEARLWMQAARAWVIERHPYLDTALTSMLLVERPGLGTVAVDARWRLYYDPQRVLDHVNRYGIETLASDWVHEVMHLLRDHLTRWDNLRDTPYRHHLFNIAADALVNTDVADLNLPNLPTDITFASLPPAAGCRRTMATEEIYRRLRRHTPKPTTPSTTTVVTNGDTIGTDCGSGTGGPRRGWEELIDGDDINDGSPDPEQTDYIRSETAHKIIAAAVAGTMSNELRRWAENVLEPVIDWRRELRSTVSRRLGLSAGNRDYSYTRLARRRVPGYTMPGMVAPAPPTVATVVDTSGSMAPADLATCLGELLGLARAVGGDRTVMTVITCDAKITGMQRVRTDTHIRQLELTGGGGTDMTVGITACADLHPIPDVIVVLTDGGTEWPDHPPRTLERTTVIALLTREGAADDVPGWIRTISVPTNPTEPEVRT